MRINSIAVLPVCFLCNILLCSFNTDSVAIEKAVYEFYLTRPDSIIEVLDDAEKHNRMAKTRIDFLRATVYENLNMIAMQENCLRRILSSTEIKSDSIMYVKTLSFLIESLEEQYKYEEALSFALQGLELVKKQGDKVNEYSLMCAMAMLSFNLDRDDDGYDLLNRVINSGKNADNARELSYVSYAYGMLINKLIDDECFDKAIEAGIQRSDLLERMKDMPGPPPGYIDQQKAYLYSKMANIYQSVGKFTQAEEAYSNFLQTEYAKNVESGYSLLPYLEKAGRNNDIINTVRKLQTLWIGVDTINAKYRALLEYQAKAEGELGNYKNMAKLNERALVLADSIYTRINNNRVHELATVFDVKDKEIRIKEEQAKAKLNFIMFSCVVVVLIVLAILMAVIYLNFLRLKRRNRIAARQVDELIGQREELRRRLVLPETNNNITSSTENIREMNVESIQSYDIFLRMERMIMEQHLFLQPDFGRDELLRITGINKNNLSGLLQKYSGAANLNNYLNRLRVEYSVKLIKENKNFSIEAIAQESGFNSRTTFYRAFYKQFGMTPTEYISSHNW